MTRFLVEQQSLLKALTSQLCHVQVQMNTVQQQQNVNQIANPADQDKAAKQMNKKLLGQIKARTARKLQEMNSDSSDSSDDDSFILDKAKSAHASQARVKRYSWGWDDDDFFGPGSGKMSKV